MDVLKNFNGYIVECENPNEILYRFQGNIALGENVVGLSFDQLLLRGSSLRNTDWVYGLVTYTGHETKIMMNSVNSKAKYSKLEKATNIYILIIVCIQMLICLLAAIFTTIWELRYAVNFSYLEISDNSNFTISLFVSFGTWFLSFVNFVPISLLVTLELVKFT